MSRKSRERREKNKAVRPDDYFSNGTFEMARFRKNTIVRNNRTPEQHAVQMEYLRTESKISQRESNPVRPIFTPHVSAKFGNHGANEYF